MITIVVLYSILILIALIVVVLHFSAVLTFHCGADGVKIKLKYLWFDLYPRKSKKAKLPPKNKEEKTKKEASASESSDSEDEFEDDFEEEISDYELMHGVSEEHEKELIEKSDTAEKNKTEQEEKKDADKKSDKAKKSKKEKIKSKSKSKTKQKKEKSSNKDGGLKSKINDLKSKYQKIKPFIPTTWKYFKKLLKSVRISVDKAQIQVGREDAHEAAIYYGAIQGFLANIFSLLSEMFTLNVKKCDVDCNFTENTINGKADITVRVRPSAVIAIVVCIAVKFLMIILKNKFKSNEIADKEPNVA